MKASPCLTAADICSFGNIRKSYNVARLYAFFIATATEKGNALVFVGDELLEFRKLHCPQFFYGHEIWCGNRIAVHCRFRGLYEFEKGFHLLVGADGYAETIGGLRGAKVPDEHVAFFERGENLRSIPGRGFCEYEVGF